MIWGSEISNEANIKSKFLTTSKSLTRTPYMSIEKLGIWELMDDLTNELCVNYKEERMKARFLRNAITYLPFIHLLSYSDMIKWSIRVIELNTEFTDPIKTMLFGDVIEAYRLFWSCGSEHWSHSNLF